MVLDDDLASYSVPANAQTLLPNGASTLNGSNASALASALGSSNGLVSFGILPTRSPSETRDVLYLPFFDNCPLQHGRHSFYGSSEITIGTWEDRTDVCPEGFACAPTSPDDTERGVCMPCIMGMRCKRGTVTHTLSTLENLCPSGDLCTTPSEDETCPVGTFCPRGTFIKGMAGKFDCTQTGAYCPAGSASPRACPEGNYCPNASVSLQCPEGSYCWTGSVVPRKCGDMTTCPAGSAKSAVSFTGFVLVGVIFAAYFLVVFAAYVWDHFHLSNPVAKAAKVVSLSKKYAASRGGSESGKGGGDPGSTGTGTAGSGDESAGEAKLDGPAFNAFKVHAQPMGFAFENLGLFVETPAGRKHIVNNVSGNIAHGQLVAVMGPSGCGKTSLMNVLCGRAFYGKTCGKLTINGVQGQILAHRKRVGFVPQDDIVHEDLTVRENLEFSARLRLPFDRTVEQRENLVNETLALLQLVRIENSIVGSVEKRGISGGQRKRVNIGLELVADPVCLFLDEPTSGLDSTSSEVVLGALKELTKISMTVSTGSRWVWLYCVLRKLSISRHTCANCAHSFLSLLTLLANRQSQIITVIHQPRYSIFTRFDHVILLGVGGRTVFSGASARALPYFESLEYKPGHGENPADFFMDVISGEVQPESKEVRGPAFLFDKWEDEGKLWLETHVAAHPNLEAETAKAHAEKVMFQPQQISKLGELFDTVVARNRALHRHLKSLFAANQTDVGTQSNRRVSGGLPMTDTGQSAATEVHAGHGGELNAHNDSPAMWGKAVKMLALEHEREVLEHRQGQGQGPDKSGSIGSSGAAAASVLDPTKPAPRVEQSAELGAFALFEGAMESSAVDLLPAQRKAVAGWFQEQRAAKASEEGAIIRREDFIGMLTAKKRPASDTGRARGRGGNGGGNGSGENSAVIYHRVTAGFWRQLWYFSRRAMVQKQRASGAIVVDSVQLVGAAALMGVINGTEFSMGQMPTNLLLVLLFFGCLSMVGALRTFGANKLMFFRESSGGINVPAFFLAQNLVDLPQLFLRPFLYAAMYTSLTVPALESKYTFFLCMLGVAWVCTGYGYLISIFSKSTNCTLTTVIVAIIMGSFLSGIKPTFDEMSPLMLILSQLSYSSWATEALIVSICNNIPAHYGTRRMLKGLSMGRNLTPEQMHGDYLEPVKMLAVIGLVTRLVAFAGLVFTRRNQQVKPTVLGMALDQVRKLRGSSSSNTSLDDAVGSAVESAVGNPITTLKQTQQV
jgi:ABC-type multidrug transport system ATPase subunit